MQSGALTDAHPRPPVVDHADWQQARADLLVREKAHTREGDAIAAARRRLPMAPVDSGLIVSANGPVPIIEAFEGRRMLIVYFFMWHHGQPFASQCEGCTLSQSHINDGVLATLAERDVSFAVFSEGPWGEISSYRNFMGWTTPWYSTSTALDNPALAGGGPLRVYLRDGDDVYLTNDCDGRGTEILDTGLSLLDLTPYGRQEAWEDSPTGWPQDPTGSWWRRDGRPIAQWLRTQAPATTNQKERS